MSFLEKIGIKKSKTAHEKVYELFVTLDIIHCALQGMNTANIFSDLIASSNNLLNKLAILHKQQEISKEDLDQIKIDIDIFTKEVKKRGLYK